MFLKLDNIENQVKKEKNELKSLKKHAITVLPTLSQMWFIKDLIERDEELGDAAAEEALDLLVEFNSDMREVSLAAFQL